MPPCASRRPAFASLSIDSKPRPDNGRRQADRTSDSSNSDSDGERQGQRKDQRGEQPFVDDTHVWENMTVEQVKQLAELAADAFLSGLSEDKKQELWKAFQWQEYQEMKVRHPKGHEVTLNQLMREAVEVREKQRTDILEGKKAEPDALEDEADFFTTDSITERFNKRFKDKIRYTQPVEDFEDEMPGVDQRQGTTLAPQHTPDLELIGRGTHWSKRPLLGYAFGGIRDGGWGIYAKVPKLLRVVRKWAVKDPQTTLETQKFYDEIMQTAKQTNLTLMAVPNRDLHLPTLRKQAEHHMLENLKLLPPDTVTDKDREMVKKVCNTMDGKYLRNTGIARGNYLKANTELIFSTNKEGELAAEANLPPKEGEAPRAFGAWLCRNPRVTFAFFASFLGPNAIDLHAKQNIGGGALYIARHRKFPTYQDVLIRPGLVPPGKSIAGCLIGFLPANFSVVKRQRENDNILNAFDLDFEDGVPMVVSTKTTFMLEWKRHYTRERLTMRKKLVKKLKGVDETSQEGHREGHRAGHTIRQLQQSSS